MTQPKDTMTQSKDTVSKSEFCNTNFSRTRGRRWAFTRFNYDDETIKHFKGIDGDCIFQEEVCPETGRKHLQGAIKFKNARTGSSLKKFDKSANWSLQQKPWLANVRYCSKLASRGGKIYHNFELENVTKNDTLDTTHTEKFEKISAEDLKKEEDLRFELELKNFMDESLENFNINCIPTLPSAIMKEIESEESDNEESE